MLEPIISALTLKLLAVHMKQHKQLNVLRLTLLKMSYRLIVTGGLRLHICGLVYIYWTNTIVLAFTGTVVTATHTLVHV